MENNSTILSLKKVILLISWAIISLTISHGVIRSNFMHKLLENNQLGLNCIMIAAVYIFCMRELNQSVKKVNGKMVKESVKFFLILIIVNLLYMILVFGRFEVAPQNYSLGLLLSVLVIAPLREELFYRYLILSMAHSKMQKTIFAVISILLFFYGHRFAYGGNLLAMVQALFLGVATTCLYLKTKNIIPSIILHFSYNLFIIVLSLM